MSKVRLRPGLWVGLAVTLTIVGCLLVAPLGERGSPAGASAGGSSGAAGDSVSTGGANVAAGGAAGAGGATSGGAAGAGGAFVCNRNSECAALPGGADVPHRCREDHRCVPLRSNECPLVYGNAAHDDAIFFGAFVGLQAVHPELSPILLSYRLAQDEFNGDARGGLPVPGNLSRVRPLVMIACNNDPSAVDAAMTHLAGDDADSVGVPAILSSMKPGDLNRAFMKYEQRQIFYMNAVGSNRTLLGTPHNGFMWHMLGQPADLAPAYVESLHLAEQYVRDSRGVGTRPLRVAVVSTTEAFDSELSDFVVPALTYNGKDTTANAADGNYLGVTVDLADPKPADDGRRICQFLPDIVVSTAGESFTQQSGVLASIEMAWQVCFEQDAAVGQRPFYILSPINFGRLSYIRQIINAQMVPGPLGTTIDSQAYRRFIGISAARAADPTLYNDFVKRLLSHFPDGEPESENFYDAFYYLAYAMYGAGSVAKVTGPGIADGMLRLISGPTPYNVGPIAMQDVISALSVATATIRLNGTLGPANFARQTGARVDVGSVFCFDENTAVRPQVLRYDPTPDDRSPGRFTGTFPCFTGFYR
jgi:hypothetical protein